MRVKYRSALPITFPQDRFLVAVSETTPRNDASQRQDGFIVYWPITTNDQLHDALWSMSVAQGRRDIKKRPVFNSFLLGGRERWLASAYQAMSETMELIMQKAAPKAETVTLRNC